MALARGEVAEGHPVAAADLRLQLMHCAREAIGREPLGQSVWLEKRAIDFIRPGSQNTMQMNGVGHDNFSSGLSSSTATYRVSPAFLRRSKELALTDAVRSPASRS